VLRLVSPLPACRRHHPGRSDRTCPHVLSYRHRPSPKFRRVSSCITLFEACSAFTHVTACTLAVLIAKPKAPAVSSPPLLLRLLPGGANQLPGTGFAIEDFQPLHVKRAIENDRRNRVRHLKSPFRRVNCTFVGVRQSQSPHG